MLKVVGDILLALGSGNLALLSLLDLSAAFDTVDHDTLLRRLQTSYGFDGVIKWFASYLSGQTQHVRTPTTTSLLSPVMYRVPHLDAEGERRHFVTISVPVVQHLPRTWHCAIQLQIGLCYATVEESRPWRGRCQVIPANHQPVRRLLYVADLLKLIKRHRLSPRAYTDDTQIYGFCQPSNFKGLADRVSTCFNDVSSCRPTGCR